MAKRAVKRRVLVVTGTRAEFGLLLPVMRSVQKHKKLSLHVVATGSHLLPPARTVREVKAAFPQAFTVPMQRAGRTGRLNDAAATARGIEGITRVIARIKPDWVVVLGDRIEAFAAASAASIAGVAVCHIHGGDRAEGIADEAMRHAITKLSHVHCAATEQSRQRIVKMGERPERVFNTGSPAIDGLRSIAAASSDDLDGLGNPGAVLLMHPAGLSEAEEFVWTTAAALTAMAAAGDRPVVWIEPNHDTGREIVIRAIRKLDWPSGLLRSAHMPRPLFYSLLKAIGTRGGALVGNSSAGLLEAEAAGIPVIDMGPRQAGRERHARVARIERLDQVGSMRRVQAVVRRLAATPATRSFGDGRAGPRIAALLARIDPHDPALLRKRNTY